MRQQHHGASGQQDSADHAGVATGRARKLQQGDLVRGLAGGCVAAGPVGAAELGQHIDPPLAETDVFVAAIPSSSGWYAVTAQSCDIAKENEPTIDVAPVELLNAADAASLGGRYSSRRFLLPAHERLQDSEGRRHVVDLAYQIPVLKVAFDKPDLVILQVLTDPIRARFATWLGHRKGRLPFPDEVVTAVLDPFRLIRVAALKKTLKATTLSQAVVEGRLAASVNDWYARLAGSDVEVFGEYDEVSLARSGLIGGDGQPDFESIGKGREKLSGEAFKKMAAGHPDAGYRLVVRVGRLDDLKASEFRTYSLLVD